MFTGLIQKVGKVKRVSRGRGLVLEFQFEPWPEPLVKGESVAVNGVCLTVCDSDATRFTADVLGETERRTGLAMNVAIDDGYAYDIQQLPFKQVAFQMDTDEDGNMDNWNAMGMDGTA